MGTKSEILHCVLKNTVNIHGSYIHKRNFQKFLNSQFHLLVFWFKAPILYREVILFSFITVHWCATLQSNFWWLITMHHMYVILQLLSILCTSWTHTTLQWCIRWSKSVFIATGLSLPRLVAVLGGLPHGLLPAILAQYVPDLTCGRTLSLSTLTCDGS